MTHLEKCKIITNKMKALGLDTSHLDEIQEELSILERPWLSKIKYSVKKHYSHLKGEMFESLEMTSLLRKGVNNLSPKERQKIKSQLLDVAKVLPAGFIAATNAILPIPFTSVLTPILLQKMGLLPSRWNESRILHLLQEEEEQLRSRGLLQLADSLHKVHDSIEDDANARETHLSLLLHWDQNQNGQWDEEEIQAYQDECKRTKLLSTEQGHTRKWFISQNGLVFGPTTFDELPEDDPDLLVKFAAQTKWVSLMDCVKA